MADAQSQASGFSTTTRLALHGSVPSASLARNRMGPAPVKQEEPSPSPSTTPAASRFTLRDKVHMLERALERSDELAQVRRRQVELLERELEAAREACRAAASVNVIVYKGPTDITVATVADSSREGISLFERTRDAFLANKRQLYSQGVGFATFEDVPVNLVQETPFADTR